MFGNGVAENLMKLAEESRISRSSGLSATTSTRLQVERIIASLTSWRPTSDVERRPQRVAVECEPFPDFDRRCFMAESDDCELHY